MVSVAVKDVEQPILATVTLDNLQSLRLYLDGVQTTCLSAIVVDAPVLNLLEVAQIHHIDTQKHEHQDEHIAVLHCVVFHWEGHQGAQLLHFQVPLWRSHWANLETTEGIEGRDFIVYCFIEDRTNVPQVDVAGVLSCSLSKEVLERREPFLRDVLKGETIQLVPSECPHARQRVHVKPSCAGFLTVCKHLETSNEQSFSFLDFLLLFGLNRVEFSFYLIPDFYGCH